MLFISDLEKSIIKFFRKLIRKLIRNTEGYDKIPQKSLPKISGPDYPCVDCIVFASCTKICDKLEMDEDKIFKHFMEYNTCIDCDSEKFSEGPTGVMCVNVKCVSCGHWFNFGLPFFIQRVRIN